MGTLERIRAQKLLRDGSLLLTDFLIDTYGLIIEQLGETTYNTDWLAAKTGDNEITVQPGKAVLFSTYPRKVELAASKALAIPTGDATYKVLIKYAESNYEEGTVDVTNGSATVTGTGTKFTEIFAVNRRIVINDEPYTVLSVESDTSLTLAENYSGDTDTDLNFKTGGWFTAYPESINDNLIYGYDSYEFVIKTGAKEDDEYWIAEVVVSGGVITTVTDKRTENIFKLFLNTPTLTDTPADVFRVNGKEVLLDDGIDSKDPINFRITDVYGHSDLVLDSEEANISLEKNKGDINRLYVQFKWGYDDVEGTGAADSTFTITNYDSEFSADELNGYYIYIPTIGNCKITDHTVNGSNQSVLTITKNGSAVDLTGVQATSSSPAIISQLTDKVVVIAIPLNSSDQEVRTSAVIERIDYPDIVGIIYPQATLLLSPGVKYKVFITNYVGSKKSSLVELTGGSYTKYEIAQNYTEPFIVKHPQISSDGASVGAKSSKNGFIVEVSGWDLAEEYEFCYTTDSSGADFTNPDHQKKIQSSKKLDVATSKDEQYYIKVRPLISGYQVATPKETKVFSGSAGQLPQPQVIWRERRAFNTALVNVTNVASGTLNDYTLTVGTPKYGFADTALDMRQKYALDLEGQILIDSAGEAFYVASIKPSSDGTTADIDVNLLPGESTAPSTGNAKIGYGSKLARTLGVLKNLPANYKITSVEVKVINYYAVSVAKAPVLRVYQRNNEPSADAIIIDSIGEKRADVDIKVTPEAGESVRDLAIDAYPSDLDVDKEKGAFLIEITVYGIPSE